MTIHTKPLLEAVSALQVVTTARSTLPALGAITLSAMGDQMVLSGTNMDQWMHRDIDCKYDGDAVTFRVPAKRLHSILSIVESPELALEVGATDLTITAGRSTFRMPLIVDSAPPVPEPEWKEPFTVQLLTGYFHALLPFVSTDPNRYDLNGIHMADGLIEASTGRIFASIVLPTKGDCIVPIEACRMVAAEKGPVTVRLSDGLAEFAGEGWTITTKLLEGNYPNTAPFRVKEEKIHTRITASREEMAQAAREAALPLDKSIDTIWVRCTESELTFHTPGFKEDLKKWRNPDSASRTIEAVAVTNPIDFAVSASGLISCMKLVGCGDVTIKFEQNPTMGVLESGNALAVFNLSRLEN